MDQLETWLAHFPRKQLLVLISEEFYANPDAAVAQVAKFLSLTPMPERSADDYEKHNLASYPEIAPPVREELARFYAPHNERLARFLGRDLPWR